MYPKAGDWSCSEWDSKTTEPTPGFKARKFDLALFLVRLWKVYSKFWFVMGVVISITILPLYPIYTAFKNMAEGVRWGYNK